MEAPREASRIEKLRQNVFEGRFSEYVLLSTVESIRYFTGFKGEEDVAFALIPVAGKGMIVTDERFKTKIEMQVSKELFDILITEPSEEYLEALKKRFSPNIQCRFYYEGGYDNTGIRGRDLEQAKKFWPDVNWEDCTKEILNIRAVKASVKKEEYTGFSKIYR